MTCAFCGYEIEGARVDAASGSYCLGHEPSARPDQRDKRIADFFEAARRMERRADGQRDWLTENAPYARADQKHLEANTPERAYWHYGYMTALRDVVRLLREPDLCNSPKP